jgi:hypothetical protein
MRNLKIDSSNLKYDVKKLRILLIILTLIQFGYMSLFFVNPRIMLDFKNKVNWLIWGLHYLVAAIFLWYNWEKLPIEKKVKTNNTFMILLLGIIGMWLWIPNDREIKRMTTE